MAPQSQPPRPYRAGHLLASGAGAVLQGRRAAMPLALLFGLTGELLVGLAWPWLREDSPLGAGDYLFLVILLNALHYGAGVGIGLVWARAASLGPDAAFAGGWPAFLGRWRRGVSRLGSVVLLMAVLALPAVIVAAMLGHILSLLIGVEAGQGLQLPLVFLALLPPALIAAATLWLSVAAAAHDAMPRFDIALKAVTGNWRAVLPAMLLAFGVAVGSQFAVLALGEAGVAPDPTTLAGMAAQIAAGAIEMVAIMVVIGGFVGAISQSPEGEGGSGGDNTMNP